MKIAYPTDLFDRNIIDGRAMLQFHKLCFANTHAMFSGDSPAHSHAEFKDLATQLFSTLQFTWIVCIIENQRVHVAVASVKYISHTQAVLF